MDHEHEIKYDHSKFGGLFGPIKKAKAYSQINYEEAYKKIENFKKDYKFRGKIEIENSGNIRPSIDTKSDIQRDNDNEGKEAK